MKYFKLAELTRSDTAQREGIDNTPNEEQVRNLTALVHCVLDPLRERWGSPIIVTSGYRCPELNRAVGGASCSYHRHGQAADIRAKNLRNSDLYDLIEAMFMEGKFALTECYISERRGYIHVALDAEENSVWPFLTIDS